MKKDKEKKPINKANKSCRGDITLSLKTSEIIVIKQASKLITILVEI